MSINKIQTYLDEIKREGRSSPVGIYWNDFFQILKKAKNEGESDPPKPLILTATAESDQSKHNRLWQQLKWALDHNYLNEALKYLKNLTAEKWDTGSPENWNKSYYPNFE